MESAVRGEGNMQSALALISEKVIDILFHAELVQLPLYINDPVVRVIAVWRMRKGI